MAAAGSAVAAAGSAVSAAGPLATAAGRAVTDTSASGAAARPFLARSVQRARATSRGGLTFAARKQIAVRRHIGPESSVEDWVRSLQGIAASHERKHSSKMEELQQLQHLLHSLASRQRRAQRRTRDLVERAHHLAQTTEETAEQIAELAAHAVRLVAAGPSIHSLNGAHSANGDSDRA